MLQKLTVKTSCPKPDNNGAMLAYIYIDGRGLARTHLDDFVCVCVCVLLLLVDPKFATY